VREFEGDARRRLVVDATVTPPTAIHHELAVQHRPGRQLLDHSRHDLRKIRREQLALP